MSKKANPAFIGSFVMGAIILCALGVMLFGSGQFFSKQEKFVLFFGESVNGLEIGAPVKFKGVKVGQVTDIKIRLENQKDRSDAIPVFIEIDVDRLRNQLGVHIDLTNREVFLSQIEDPQLGLRAKLQLQSMVTGLLFIELDYMGKDAPPVRFEQQELVYKEIPTVGGNIEKLFKQLEESLYAIGQIDFVGISDHTKSILVKVDAGLDEVQFGEINDNVVGVAKDVRTLVTNPALVETITTVQEVTTKVKRLTTKLEGKIDPLSEDFSKAITSFDQTMTTARETLATIRDSAEPDSPLRIEAERTLEEVREAAHAIKLLADYIERNPNALITGRAQE